MILNCPHCGKTGGVGGSAGDRTHELDCPIVVQRFKVIDALPLLARMTQPDPEIPPLTAWGWPA